MPAKAGPCISWECSDLTQSDQVASNLLANDDRWADISTFSRELIELAMMKPTIANLLAGAHKAVEAYGRTVGANLNNAVTYLRERPHCLDEYISARKSTPPVQLSGRAAATCPQDARRSAISPTSD